MDAEAKVAENSQKPKKTIDDSVQEIPAAEVERVYSMYESSIKACLDNHKRNDYDISMFKTGLEYIYDALHRNRGNPSFIQRAETNCGVVQKTFAINLYHDDACPSIPFKHFVALELAY